MQPNNTGNKNEMTSSSLVQSMESQGVSRVDSDIVVNYGLGQNKIDCHCHWQSLMKTQKAR